MRGGAEEGGCGRGLLWYSSIPNTNSSRANTDCSRANTDSSRANTGAQTGSRQGNTMFLLSFYGKMLFVSDIFVRFATTL